MVRKMIINSVYIENFRGFKDGKKFDFNQKSFVLLSASNGKGKTTIIDAIEWCLTGEIGRLSNSYNARSTNDTERRKNLSGLLKNKNCEINEKAKVVLSINYYEENYKIERSQKKDALDVSESEVLLNGKSEGSDKFLKKFVDKNFYNYYFCDVQKTFNLLSKKRSDLSELFEEFISDYSREENIVYNLSIFEDDISRKIDELKMKKISDDVIQNYRNTLLKYSNEPNLITYKSTMMYKGELVDLTKISLEDMRGQLKLLYKCGYNQVSSILKNLIDDEVNKSNHVLLTSLLKTIKSKKDKIDDAIKMEFHNNYSKIDNVFNQCEKLKKLKLNHENIKFNLEILYNLENSKFTKAYYCEVEKEINDKNNEIIALNDEIKVLTNGNEIIDTLATIISKKKGLIEYRNELKKNDILVECPICGTSEFSKVNDEEILKTAIEYMGKYNSLIIKKKENLDMKKKDLKLTYDRMLNMANYEISQNISILEEKYLNLNTLKNETSEFFSNLNKFNKDNALKYSIEKLISKDFIEEEIKVVYSKFYSEKQLSLFRIEYNDLLDLLGYKKDENEVEKGTYNRVVTLSSECPEIIEFSITLLADKINSLNSYILNSEYLSTQKKLQISLDNNNNIDNKIENFSNLGIKAKVKAEYISELVNKLKKEEFENVGPFLYEFYKKLSKAHSVTEISILNEENKINLSDEKNKNLMNVLSNGQLSVFMLAYFLAGAISRNENTKFKVYFIDDLTACMDDINMLSFIDFIKYLLKEKHRFMEQIFFVTCDDRIRKLIEYKLKGGGIKFQEIGESNFN